ncbi:ABC transporter permease [Bradyrhizobium sp. STM 3809]|uniref:ABC transporter permease n=1 Tax=Bradyrhizobium sp. STM 3809 TaxID=551936 RepID=UPI00024093A9|nr:ABC transporter permease [Bradyrhizobium sp. STM 3809]CCE01514.1 putative ABC transporter (permease protein) [Bradyrhizobium sp. STM 3809]
MQRDLGDRVYGGLVGALAAASTLLLLAPTLVVLIISLTSGMTLKFPPPSWSLRWYVELFRSPEILAPALTSLRVASCTTLFSAVLGSAAALGIFNSRSRLARLLDALFMSPMVLPAMAFSLSLLLVFNVIGLRLSFWTLVLGHTIVCVPFVIRMVGAAVQQLDPTLVTCSLSLGASRWYTFRRITLPLIRRGITAGSLVAFLSSFDNVPVSLFLADARTEVLPIKLWAILEGSLDVRVAAVSGVIVVITLLGLVCAEALGGLSRSFGKPSP